MKKLGQAVGSGLALFVLWLALALLMNGIGPGTLLTGLATAGVLALGIYLSGRRKP